MKYPMEFREQILIEIQEVGIITLVCRKHAVKTGMRAFKLLKETEKRWMHGS